MRPPASRLRPRTALLAVRNVFVGAPSPPSFFAHVLHTPVSAPARHLAPPPLPACNAFVGVHLLPLFILHVLHTQISMPPTARSTLSHRSLFTSRRRSLRVPATSPRIPRHLPHAAALCTRLQPCHALAPHCSPYATSSLLCLHCMRQSLRPPATLRRHCATSLAVRDVVIGVGGCARPQQRPRSAPPFPIRHCALCMIFGASSALSRVARIYVVTKLVI